MSTRKTKKEKWSREKAIADLLEIKNNVFDSIAAEDCDQKTVKLAIDIIKELNSICGLEEVKADARAEEKIEVVIQVVDS